MSDLKIGRVYMITSPSNKVYVGSTIQAFKNRWKFYHTLNCKQQRKLYNSLKNMVLKIMYLKNYVKVILMKFLIKKVNLLKFTMF